MLLHHFLSEQAAARPEAPLLVAGGRRATYGELATEAGRVACGLVRAGISPGDRVALLSRNSTFYVAAYYGTLAAGAISVPLNTAADERLLRELLGDSGARALLAGRGFGAQAIAVAAGGRSGILTVLEEAPGAEVPAGTLPYTELTGGTTPGAPEVSRDPDDPAAIVYTSGSTGRPRGATLSHRNLIANTRAIVSYLRLSADDVVMDVLPFHYVYGKSLLNTHVAAGGSLVVEESLLFPDAVLDRMIEEGVTGLSGVPSTFAILLSRSSLAERDFPALRYVTQAGGAMSVEHTRRLVDALPGKEIFVMYGATEASARLTYLAPSELARKIGSIGKPIPGVEIDLLTEDGRLASPGEVGEIVARGENIMLGYWNDEEETRRVMDDRGLRTGDLAVRDEEGFLTIVGRKRDMIKSGANRIAAREVEEELVREDAIEEAAVIGVPDEMLGEAIHAFVTAAPGHPVDADAVVESLRARLPGYKLPRRIEVLAELPRTGSGKIDKESLRARNATPER